MTVGELVKGGLGGISQPKLVQQVMIQPVIPQFGTEVQFKRPGSESEIVG